MLRPCLILHSVLALMISLGVSLGLLGGITLDPETSASVVGSFMWALAVMGAIGLAGAETPAFPAERPKKRWFEYEGGYPWSVMVVAGTGRRHPVRVAGSAAERPSGSDSPRIPAAATA